MNLTKLGSKEDMRKLKLILNLFNGTIDKIVDLDKEPWDYNKPKWNMKGGQKNERENRRRYSNLSIR
jgi:hypothetical protein